MENWKYLKCVGNQKFKLKYIGLFKAPAQVNNVAFNIDFLATYPVPQIIYILYFKLFKTPILPVQLLNAVLILI